MMTALIVLGIWFLVALVAGFVIGAYLRKRDEPLQRFEQAVKRRVVLHSKAGHSVDGVLSGVYADGVCVTDAAFMRPGEPDVPLEGAQIMPWQSIEWIQELGHARSENA